MSEDEGGKTGSMSKKKIVLLAALALVVVFGGWYALARIAPQQVATPVSVVKQTTDRYTMPFKEDDLKKAAEHLPPHVNILVPDWTRGLGRTTITPMRSICLRSFPTMEKSKSRPCRAIRNALSTALFPTRSRISPTPVRNLDARDSYTRLNNSSIRARDRLLRGNEFFHGDGRVAIARLQGPRHRAPVPAPRKSFPLGDAAVAQSGGVHARHDAETFQS